MARKTTSMPPLLREWTPGLPQLGIFIRDGNGNVIEWVSNRGTRKQMDALAQVIRDKTSPDDYDGPAIWAHNSAGVEVRNLLGHWTMKGSEAMREAASKALLRLTSGPLLVDIHGAGVFDDWGKAQLRKVFSLHQHRSALISNEPILFLDDLKVVTFSDKNTALDSRSKFCVVA